MTTSRRLTVTLAYKAAGAVPKILYLGHDADEALSALEMAKNKDYFEVRVCRDIDLNWMSRYRSPEPARVG